MSIFGAIKNAIKKVPIVGKPLASVYGVAISPAELVSDLAHGTRIDHALVGSFKSQLKDVQTLAPYAQTVISFVPGVGQGVNAAIAASVALAEGHPITEAVMTGIQGSLPGGPLAKSAFNAATALAQGKKLNEVALQALPIPPEQKGALNTALEVSQKIARGEKVQDAVLHEALKQLPPDVSKAVQIGIAVGNAAKIQKTSKKAAVKVDTVLKAVNSKNPSEKRAALAAVQKTQAKAEKGDKQAAAMLTMLGRHAAAKRVTNRFRVHARTGIVFRIASPKHAMTPAKHAAARHAAPKHALVHR